MRKVQEVIRLSSESGLSERAISRSLGLSRDTVSRILARAADKGLSWPLPSELDETALEQILFPNTQGRPKNCTEPDWNTIHMEYRKKVLVTEHRGRTLAV